MELFKNVIFEKWIVKFHWVNMLLTCIDVVLGLQLCHEFSILQHGGRFVPTQMFYTILVYQFESCSYNEYQEIASISRQDGG